MESPKTKETSEGEVEEVHDLSHQEALDLVQKTLTAIVSSDSLLNDLPTPLTLEEVTSQIALECGQAMTVNVVRADGQVLPIVVQQDATVLTLKNAIERKIKLSMARKKDSINLSWRYTWKTYWLYFEGQKLKEDQKKLKEYGIRNRDQVTFVKRLKER